MGIANDILSGTHDGELDSLYNAITARRKVLKQLSGFTFFHQLRVGDKVRFNSTVRPRYLAGKLCEITDKKQKKVVVRMVDGGVGRFSGGGITCPVDLLERV